MESWREHLKDNPVRYWMEMYAGGGYEAFFPSFYPDGDYFFIDSKFENGYLGHPWRWEIWVFGKSLIDEISKVADDLGWKVVE